MRIIGINSGLDAGMREVAAGSAALIVDGEIVLAVAEERVSRVKYMGGYKHALAHIFKETGYSPQEIDFYYISFYGNPMIPNQDIIDFHIKDLGLTETPEKMVVVSSHHLSHAALAFFLSPYDEAVIIVADNEGSLVFPKGSRELGTRANSCERNSYFWARGNSISLIGRDFEVAGSIGFGKAYNKFNRTIGFGDYHTAGKTMGLAPYGKLPAGIEGIDLWSMDSAGNLVSNMPETYDSHRDVAGFFKKYGIDIPIFDEPEAYNRTEYKNLAFYVQSQLNKWCLKKAQYLSEKTGIRNFCISGGVALNGVMNAHLEDHFGIGNVFAPPFSSDPGQGLGNAIIGYVEKSGLNHNTSIRKFRYKNVAYLGATYSGERIEKSLSRLREKPRTTVEKPGQILEKVATLLASGKIIGWFQGRSEYGARALGNRSLLADPRSAAIRDRMNTMKRREMFRPLAPSVLGQYVSEYFETSQSCLDPYMLRVAYARKDKAHLIPGVVHVDGTSRLQEVTQEANPLYYGVIREFFRLTGIPMVLNTSFNLAEEPIVEAPEEAIETFYNMNLDALVLGEYLIIREQEK